jgi:hypothetical protein
MRHTFGVFVIFLLLCTARFAATVEPPHADINIVSWLSGRWKGEAFGGVAEEIWSQPAGGSMIGMFRLIDKGTIAFSEFEEIVEQDNQLIFKVKHFTPAFVGWEEKEKSVDFKLLSSTENEIRFDGLTLAKIDNNTCKFVIKIEDKATGKTKDVEILYHREGN